MRETILRTQQVCERLSISPTTLWRWRKSKQFPDPRHFPGSSMQGWSEATVNSWIAKNFSTQGEE